MPAALVAQEPAEPFRLPAARAARLPARAAVPAAALEANLGQAAAVPAVPAAAVSMETLLTGKPAAVRRSVLLAELPGRQISPGKPRKIQIELTRLFVSRSTDLRAAVVKGSQTLPRQSMGALVAAVAHRPTELPVQAVRAEKVAWAAAAVVLFTHQRLPAALAHPAALVAAHPAAPLGKRLAVLLVPVAARWAVAAL